MQRIPQILFLLLFVAIGLAAQDSTYREPTVLPVRADRFEVDQLQNIYLIEEDHIFKLNPAGLPIMDYANPRLGTLGQVDASNPFSVVLFYPEFMSIVTLDRNMTETGQFNLFDLDILRTNAVGTASDNNLWVFDEVNSKLLKVGREGEIVTEGQNLYLLLNRPLRPDFLREHDQLVYVNEPELGILVFDVFGKYLKTIPITNLERFEFFGNQLLYREGAAWVAFHLKTLLTRELPLPSTVRDTAALRWAVDRLYALEEKGLWVYPLRRK